MNKLLLLLLMLTNLAIFGSNNYDTINGKASNLEVSKFFLSIKLDNSSTKADFIKEISNIEYLPKISEVKELANDSFVVKFKDEISSEIIKKIKADYKILPSYTLNQNVWPLVTDNTINIKFKDGISEAEIKSILLKNNLKIIDTDIFIKSIHTVITNEDAFYMANKLFATGLFDFSNPNFYMHHIKKFTPNDTYFSDQWHHDSNTAGVYSEGAWDINRGSTSIKIAIIDDGMELTHPDLNVVASSDFSGASTGFNDAGEHGTSCAGVSAAKGNNGIGVSGACPNCSIIAAKMMRADGYSLQNADANAFNWAISQGAAVFNNSWGYSQDFNINDYNPRLVSAINYAVTNARSGQGGVVLFASGNENRRFSSTSLEGLPNIIAVGATTNYGSRASYSNYGTGLDVVAPSNGGSLGIWTTDRIGSKGYNNNGHYVVDGTDYGYGTDLSDDDYSMNFGGTSSATPLVSGIVGLMLSENSSLTPSQVRQILENTADKIGSGYDSIGHSDYLGYGKVNAKKALEYVRNLNGCTPDPNGENCSNNLDDDCDGAIDANDTDCQTTPDACEGVNCPANSHCDVDSGDNQAYCYCDEGYHVNSDYTACESDNTNTGVCDGIDCTQYYANTVCVDDGGNPACGCLDGYVWNSAQTACELATQVDPCDGITCSGHGVCADNNGSATCNCYTGYYHDGNLHCILENVDPCEGITCSGHGLCANINGMATCNCDENYIHDGSLHCLLDTSNPCEGILCSNHGLCANNNGVAQCNCDLGYHSQGLYCVQDTADVCDGILCSNHGVCANNNGTAICNCDSGYHAQGLYCIQDSDICEGITCSGHGVCANYNGTAKCNCDTGYYSDENLHCIQEDNTDCSNVTCNNHGTCYNDVNNIATCTCDAGYQASGTSCIKTSSTNASGCNYSSTNNTQLPLLFMMFLLSLILIRKKLKN